jgi:uncharacterized protein
MEDLLKLLEDIPVIDVHEHHMPGIILNRDVGLLRLLQESYCNWTRKRPYPLPSELPVGPMAELGGRGTWEEISPFVVESGTNAFIRNMVGALAELYELPEPRITSSNWEALDERIRARHADSSWNGAILDQAGIEAIITDPYLDPLLDAAAALGDRYRSVLRINPFALGWAPEARDHSGNRGHELLGKLGIAPVSFDDYLDALPKLFDAMPSLGKIGLKDALAYDRGVDYAPPDARLARKAWKNPRAAEDEKKAFGDFVVDRLCVLAGERGIPVQMHLGLGLIRGSHPLNAAGLIERHPGTRFLLMHMGYPWTSELFGMAMVYRNIWIDLTWSWLLSPSLFSRSLREAIEILPDESRMMLGGDNWHVEETYGAITGARRLIAEVLEGCVRDGQFPRADAERLGARILHDNAAAFFHLAEPRRDLP